VTTSGLATSLATSPVGVLAAGVRAGGGHAVAGVIGSRLAATWAAARPVPASVLVVPVALASSVSAAVWAGVTWRWGVGAGTLPLLGLAWVVLTAADVDLRSHAIPDRLTLRSGVVLAGTLAVLGTLGVRAALMAVAVPVLLLLTSGVFRLARGEAGVGLGDVKLAIPIGLVLGRLGVGYVALALVVTFVAAGVVSAVLLALGRIGARDRVPYGPYLALGTVVALIGGDPVAGLVAGLVGPIGLPSAP
jgi:leader peptidase (prepilin peptidase) / N-methyltransferase